MSTLFDPAQRMVPVSSLTDLTDTSAARRTTRVPIRHACAGRFSHPTLRRVALSAPDDRQGTGPGGDSTVCISHPFPPKWCRPVIAALQPHLGSRVVLEQAAGADILPDHGQALVASLGHDGALAHPRGGR